MAEAASGLAGMTVHERFVVRGLTAGWTAAVAVRGWTEVVGRPRHFAVADAPRLADIVPADPAAYGL